MFRFMLIVAELDTAVNMFKQVLIKLVDTKWRTTDHAYGILTQYKKFVSEMKQFHHEKFAGFNFEDRLDAFLYDVLNTQKTYEDLWTPIKFHLALCHGEAVVERGLSVNKETLAPNFKDSFKAISAEQIEIA